VSARRLVGVLVSGAGTNLEALLRACENESFPATVALVVSNRRAAPALKIADAWKVPSLAMPLTDFGGVKENRDRAMVGRLRSAGVDLVVCAGYDRILSDEFLSAFPDAILNVHPSLLPAFAGGMDAVEQALAHGVKITGCTVQLLEPGETDGGPIVLQAAVSVEPDDDVESLRTRIHEAEWQLLPRAVELWCTGRLRRQGRVIRIADATETSVSGLSSGTTRSEPRWGPAADSRLGSRSEPLRLGSETVPSKSPEPPVSPRAR
jgi:phosphoribosylglycinamide formyltransferase-1